MSGVTAGDLLTLHELRTLRRVSSVRGAGLVLHAWATIAAAMLACALWPSPVTFLVAVVVIGTRQLGLLVLMHEAAHWLLFARPALNTWVGTWLCGGPVGSDLPSYRRVHHLHHRHTREPEDPDLALARVPRTLWSAILQDLSGWTAAARLLRQRAWRPLRGPLLCHAVLSGALTAMGHWELYVLLWLLPLATWCQVLVRLRHIAEHGAVSDDRDPLRNARTTRAHLLGRALIAPYWVNYHLEHHLMVFVPCWKLARAHALLLGKGYGARMEVAPSYVDVLRRVTS
jgi:fatty acid desaturase